MVDDTLELEAMGDLRPGDCLAGRYRIEGVLGVGGTAAVYRAHDLRLRRDVAIKVVLPELRKSWKSLQRFVREGQAMAALDSPHVVPVYDVGQDGERCFMVMKLVEAPTVGEVIKQKGPFGEVRALEVAAGILAGLIDLHAKGIVHRDVKPSNVILDENDGVMLLDFGIARDSSSDPGLTQEGVVVGTPAYMAPEQLFSPRAVDARTDIYATGVLLFEMLTGELPFGGETPVAVITSHATRPVPDPRTLRPSISEVTARIILRAMEKQQGQRYGSAVEMLGDVRAAAAALARGLDDAMVPPRDRRPWLVLGLLATSAAAAVALALVPAVETPVIVARPLPPRRPTPPPPPAEPAPEAPPPPVVEAAPEVEAPPRRLSRRPKPPVTVTEAPPLEAAALPSRHPDVQEAQAALRAGNIKRAVELLRGVIRGDPTSGEPYATLGDAYAKTGNKVAAIAAYRRYLALEPNGHNARRVEAALDRLGGR